MDTPEPTSLERIRQFGTELQRDPATLSFAVLADALREEGLLRKAAEVCRRGLSMHPDYVTGHIVMGQICADMLDREGARAAFEAALAMQPHSVVARLELSRVLLEERRFDHAAKHLEHVLFLNPGHSEARELLRAARARRVPPSARRRRAESPAAVQPSATDERKASDVRVPQSGHTEASVMNSAVQALRQIPGVSGALLVHADGLPVTGATNVGDEETVAASVLSMYEAMRAYAERLEMGSLGRAIVDSGSERLVLASAGSGVLMVDASPDAKMGLVNMHIDRALETLSAPA